MTAAGIGTDRTNPGIGVAVGEIERLNREVDELKAMRKKLAEQVHTDRIEGRTMPPLSQLTRTQKRYFLEPWFTTIAVAAGGLTLLVGLAAVWTPLHWQFGWTAGLFALVGLLAVWAKVVHRTYNVQTEGNLLAPKNRSDYY